MKFHFYSLQALKLKSNFIFVKTNININWYYVLRFLHEESDRPYFKLGKDAKVTEGKARTTSALLFCSSGPIGDQFVELLKVIVTFFGR